MQITVNIPDEVVTQAQARGLTPERYVENLIAERKTVLTAKGVPPKQSLAEFKASLERLASNSEGIPILLNETFSRDSLYKDHD